MAILDDVKAEANLSSADSSKNKLPAKDSALLTRTYVRSAVLAVLMLTMLMERNADSPSNEPRSGRPTITKALVDEMWREELYKRNPDYKIGEEISTIAEAKTMLAKQVSDLLVLGTIDQKEVNGEMSTEEALLKRTVLTLDPPTRKRFEEWELSLRQYFDNIFEKPGDYPVAPVFFKFPEKEAGTTNNVDPLEQAVILSLHINLRKFADKWQEFMKQKGNWNMHGFPAYDEPHPYDAVQFPDVMEQSGSAMENKDLIFINKVMESIIKSGVAGDANDKMNELCRVELITMFGSARLMYADDIGTQLAAIAILKEQADAVEEIVESFADDESLTPEQQQLFQKRGKFVWLRLWVRVGFHEKRLEELKKKPQPYVPKEKKKNTLQPTAGKGIRSSPIATLKKIHDRSSRETLKRFG